MRHSLMTICLLLIVNATSFATDYSPENAIWEVFTNTESVTGIVYSADGKTKWVGSSGGLEQCDAATGKRLRLFTHLDGLPDIGVNQLLADGSGGIWIGTQGGGMAHLAVGLSSPAKPAPSQSSYQNEDSLYITMPVAYSAIDQYVALTMPGYDGLLMATDFNEINKFKDTLMPWTGGSAVLSLLDVTGLPKGIYSVYLLHLPAGVDPLAGATNQGQLGVSSFEIK